MNGDQANRGNNSPSRLESLWNIIATNKSVQDEFLEIQGDSFSACKTSIATEKLAVSFYSYSTLIKLDC